ncbi:YaeF family permuted papain-like enzyme [Entomohabitans teleogrylli]|uniref:YaeF family permuted papain-like enzyme n=1 Tax=Entomohabitans teleogrylli TaxID=1384589 RepID=UPI00073DA75D|nr:YaeF family permuted papain-like enzyme [Entomohabitans teleogrylli]
MKYLPVAVLLSAALSGCTLDIATSSSDQTSAGIRLQQLSSATPSSLTRIRADQLQAGDLLFSSSIALSSLGIRLFSATSVSHVAIYLGDGQVAEAVGSGVQILPLAEVEEHSDKLFALRVPAMTPEAAEQIKQFAHAREGRKYNYSGILEMVPFMVTKQICNLNPFSRDFRQQCVSGLADAQLSHSGASDSYFCSQFVSAAYEFAGIPLTRAKTNWLSPADLLHMREGDVATFAPQYPLSYVGHLKKGLYLNIATAAQPAR